MVVIRPAHFPADLETVRQLFTEYADWLNVDLCFQGFEEELATLPGKYAPPAGSLVLATEGNRVLGCAALRKFDSDVCEVKRLWVRPNGRRNGVGRALMERIETDARTAGYTTAVLDTLDRMAAALSLYESLGYERTGAYYHNPIPGAVYLRKDLTSDR